MNYIKIGLTISLTTCFFLSIISYFILTKSFNKDVNVDISAYYNTGEFFAGFVQHKNGLIRACEFSVNGEFLSCSKWFDNEGLKQGKNEGVKIIRLKALPKI